MEKVSEKSFSFNTSYLLRGIASILVIIHHISEYMSSTSVFKYSGIVAVSVFLFVSGYGISQKFNENGVGYVKKIMTVKIPYIILAYIVADVLYLAVRLLIGQTVKFSFVLVEHSWYVFCILYMYASFCICCGLFKNKYLMCIAAALWMAVMFCTNAGLYRYISVPAFLLGLAAAEQKKIKIPQVGVKGSIASAVIIISVLCVLPYIPVGHYYSRIVKIIIGAVAVVLTVVLSYSMKNVPDTLKISKVLRCIGKYSFEMYMYQGAAWLIAVKLFSGNWGLTVLFTLSATAVFSLIMFRVDKSLMKLWSKMPFLQK